MFLKLKKLNHFLKVNNYAEESVILNSMIDYLLLKNAANETVVIPDDNATAILPAAHRTEVIPGDYQKKPVERIGKPLSKSEEVIRSVNESGIGVNIEVLKFIAGTEAGQKGHGKMTAEGNIYQVLFNKQVAVAKILPIGSSEPDIWNFIDSMDLTEDERKHLPRIFDIIPALEGWVIIMEMLEPYSSHIKSVLKGSDYRTESDMISNQSYMHDIVNKTFESLPSDLRSLPNTEEEQQMFDIIISNIDDLKLSLEREVLIYFIEIDKIFEFIKKNIIQLKKNIKAQDSVDMFINSVADYVQKKINSFLTPSTHPIPKYYSADPIDSTIEQLERSGVSRGRIRRLKEERDTKTYNISPESYYYSEKYMPETKSLFSLIKKMKDMGLEWSDLHTGNIMKRSGTNDLVIIDVGLYDMM